MNKLTYILFLSLIAFGCKKSISESDKRLVNKLNEKAVEYRLKGDLENAKRTFAQALQILPSDTFIRYEFVGIYVEQDSLEKALELLEKMPADQKNTDYYYQVKGGIFDYKGHKEKAIGNYKKALELAEKPEIQNEMDLGPLINYAMLETLSGKKEIAVSRLNEALKLEWLTESNKDYLETFRNEFEFYQGNGTLEFDPTNDIAIRTTNSDSIKLILRENHINVSGSSSGLSSDTTEIYISEKYRNQLEKIKNAP